MEKNIQDFGTHVALNLIKGGNLWDSGTGSLRLQVGIPGFDVNRTFSTINEAADYVVEALGRQYVARAA